MASNEISSSSSSSLRSSSSSLSPEKAVAEDVALGLLQLLQGKSPNPVKLRKLPREAWGPDTAPYICDALSSFPFSKKARDIFPLFTHMGATARLSAPTKKGDDVTGDEGGYRTISNTSFMPHVADHFGKVATPCGEAGRFGSVTYFPIAGACKGLVLKRYPNRDVLRQIHRAIDLVSQTTGKTSREADSALCSPPRPSRRRLRRAWEFFGPTLVKVNHGYVMWEANETGRHLEWLHTLLDMAVLFGLVHGDLKETNIYKGGLIDWDNVLYQCAGMDEYCMCDNDNYDFRSEGLVANEIRNALRLVGAEENGFFLYVAACYLYVLSSRKIDVRALVGPGILGLVSSRESESGDDKKGKKDPVVVKMIQEPPWPSFASYPRPSKRDLDECTLCRLEFSCTIMKILRGDGAVELAHVEFPQFGGLRVEHCNAIFGVYCKNDRENRGDGSNGGSSSEGARDWDARSVASEKDVDTRATSKTATGDCEYSYGPLFSCDG